MKSLSDVKFSTLDLVPVRANGSPAQSLRNSLDLAQHVEKFGYNRFWVAEHHNMDGIASSATSVLLGYLAGGTSTIRVGSGGVMLPNHAPLVIAEQFGTLESLYPGRIDLGLGRANQLFRVGAFTAFETGLEAVGRFTQYAGFRRNGTQASLQVTFPMRGCFFNDTHSGLLERWFCVSKGSEDSRPGKVHLVGET